MAKSTKPKRTKPTPAPAQPGGRVIWLGMAPDDDPIYQSGWNYLSGKNLNPHSVEPTPKPEPEKN